MPNTGRPSRDCHACRKRRVKVGVARPRILVSLFDKATHVVLPKEEMFATKNKTMQLISSLV